MAVVTGALSLATARTIVLSQPSGHKVLHVVTRPLGCDSTIVLAVARLSAPVTTATHLRVIRLCRVLTDHPPSGSSIDPASVAV